MDEGVETPGAPSALAGPIPAGGVHLEFYPASNGAIPERLAAEDLALDLGTKGAAKLVHAPTGALLGSSRAFRRDAFAGALHLARAGHLELSPRVVTVLEVGAEDGGRAGEARPAKRRKGGRRSGGGQPLPDHERPRLVISVDFLASFLPEALRHGTEVIGGREEWSRAWAGREVRGDGDNDGTPGRGVEEEDDEEDPIGDSTRAVVSAWLEEAGPESRAEERLIDPWADVGPGTDEGNGDPGGGGGAGDASEGAAGARGAGAARPRPAPGPGLGPDDPEGPFASSVLTWTANPRDRVFSLLSQADWSEEAPDPPGLKSTLFRYQRRALSWMLWREGVGEPAEGSRADRLERLAASLGGAGASVARVRLPSGSLIEFDFVRGAVREPGAAPRDGRLLCGDAKGATGGGDPRARGETATDGGHAARPPSADPSRSTGAGGTEPAPLDPPALRPFRGGLLCDEMGLGKTVEVIALVLANPGPKGGNRGETGDAGAAPPGAEGAPTPPAERHGSESADGEARRVGGGAPAPDGGRTPGGTLVVCPPALVQQWRSELANHAGGSLTVEIYEGLQTGRDGDTAGGGSGEPPHPEATPAGVGAGAGAEPGVLRGIGAASAPASGGQAPAAQSDGTAAPPSSSAAARAPPSTPPQERAQAFRPLPFAPDLRRGPAAAEAEYAAARAAGLPLPGAPQREVDREVRARVRDLAAADVVVTSLDVLRAEVHYSPEAPRLRALRHAKRYAVPTCPLLALDWWRVVVDEAQAVGPLSAAATVLGRARARHRWAVTGTPLGGARELEDVAALLGAVRAEPLSRRLAWRRAVLAPIAWGRPDLAWRNLAVALGPTGWRQTKAVVALESPLPPRDLVLNPLRFSPGEKEFYSQILERTRASRDALRGIVAAARARRAEGERAAAGGVGEGGRVVGDGPGSATAEPGSPPAAAGARAAPAPQGRKRHGKQRKDALARAQEEETTNVGQLRLACTHPQLTKHWKALEGDLQLSLGGTLSMVEIMQRLSDRASQNLQALERAYCAAANTLATVLLEQATKAEGTRDSGDAGDRGGEEGGGVEGARDPKEEPKDEPAGELGGKPAGEPAGELAGKPAGEPATPASPRSPTPATLPTLPARPAKLTSAQRAAVEALRVEALELLESSFRVAEKGIDAIDRRTEDIKGMPDIAAASGQTVTAWKLLQLNTARQLARLRTLRGEREEAARAEKDAQDKRAYVRGTAEAEVATASSKLEAAREAAARAEERVSRAWGEARSLGYPRYLPGCDLPGDPAATLAEVARQHARAAEEEARELSAQASAAAVERMLGTRVERALAEAEARVGAHVQALERREQAEVARSWISKLRRDLDRVHRLEGDGGGEDGGRKEEGGGAGPRGWEEAAGAGGVPPRAAPPAAQGAGAPPAGAAEAAAGPPAEVPLALAVNATLDAACARAAEALWVLPDFSRRRLAASFVDALPSVSGIFSYTAPSRARGLDGETKAGHGKGTRAAQSDEAGADVSPGEEGGPVAERGEGGHSDVDRRGKPEHKEGDEGRGNGTKAYVTIRFEAAGGASFIPSKMWLGAVPGYIFTTRAVADGGSAARDGSRPASAAAAAARGVGAPGAPTEPAVAAAAGVPRLGYHLDTPPVPPVARSRQRVAQLLQATLRGLQEHQKRLARAWQAAQGSAARGGGTREAIEELPKAAVEARLVGARSLVELLKHLRDAHVASGQLRLKSAQLTDVDETLAAAERDPPERRAAKEVLRRRMHAARQAASAQASKKRFLERKVAEAEGEGEGGGEAEGSGEGGGGKTGGGGAARAGHSGGTTGTGAGAGVVPGTAAPDAPTAAPDAPPAPPGDTAGSDQIDDPADECPVCYVPLSLGGEAYVFGNCGHAFCADCATQQVLGSGTCALCRQPVSRRSVLRVAVAARGQGASRASGGSAGAPDAPAPSGADWTDPTSRQLARRPAIRGEWSAKIAALLRRLLCMAHEAPHEKALVFSQHASALDLVALALRANGLRFVALSSRYRAGGVKSAILDFREDDEVRVFLLPHRAGAAGLTLVRASNVFLLEPSLDPSIEQQAIARVHRIGQTRPVRIHRLFVEGSIEEAVMARAAARADLLGAGGAAAPGEVADGAPGLGTRASDGDGADGDGASAAGRDARGAPRRAPVPRGRRDLAEAEAAASLFASPGVQPSGGEATTLDDPVTLERAGREELGLLLDDVL